VAVCDDLSLRNRLAGTLHAELGVTSARASDAQGYPKLVSLNLNLSDPNPLAQIAQWLAQNRQLGSSIPAPAFQFVGIERLTRRSPAAQRLFLRRLQAIERYLPRLESTLLLWLPRPWFYTIQQSVPEFWQWHTGIFEFEGEPTPLPPVGASKPEASHVSPTSEEKTGSSLEASYPSLVSDEGTGSFKEDLQRLLTDDLVEDVDLASLGESSRKNQHPSKNSERHPADSGTAIDKTNTQSSSPTNQGQAIPYSAPTKKPSPYETPPINLDTDLRLGDATQESEVHQIDELVSNYQSQLQNPKSGESVEELQVATSDLQPANLPFGNASDEQTSTQQEQQSQALVSPVDTYLQLGNYYRQAIEQGDATEENLAIALQAYEQALQFLDNSSPQASDILNDIGNLYWMLSRCPTSAEHALSYLEQSIQSYQLALTKLIAEEVPHTYAMIQNNLGAAYGDLARHQDPADNLEQSVRAYNEALRYRRADSEPMKYASTQNNLGTAHWHLAQHHSSVPNLQAAIAAYTEAISFYHPQSEPLNWAMIQNNLGTAYWNLAQYEQPETWLELAIVSYQEALKYRTPEVTPAACAATQNNLGTAYWHLADRIQNNPEGKAEYLHQCIAAYESALAIAGRQPFAPVEKLEQATPPISVNFDIFATHNNLGLAHYQLATDPHFSLTKESKFAHLEAALDQHVKASTGVAAESDAYQTTLTYIVRTIRVFYSEGGISGQNRALSKVPGQLLPEILPRL
jgi:tetratricopeptide (TPR) repeat protein